MPDGLQGKVAIVTGASRGIGRAIALRLAELGSTVVLAARSEALLQQAADAIAADGGAASLCAVDLRLADTPAAVVAHALDRHGQLDIVVNCAGATKRGDFLELTDEDWVDGYALKLFGAVRLTRAAWPHLQASKGQVLNIIGIGGRQPGGHFTIGGSVNGALLTFTKALADVGLRDGVRVNAVNPGPVATDRWQARIQALKQEMGGDEAAAVAALARESKIMRVGQPSEIAGLAAFVLSDEGSLFHGALIDMDGGTVKAV